MGYVEQLENKAGWVSKLSYKINKAGYDRHFSKWSLREPQSGVILYLGKLLTVALSQTEHIYQSDLQ